MSDPHVPSSTPACLPRRRLVIGLGLVLSGCEPYVRGGPVYEPPTSPTRTAIATLDIDGPVEVVHEGRTLTGRDGMPLFTGDRVRTYASSYALCRFRDGDAVWLDRDTHVRMGSVFTFFGRVFASVSGVFQVDSEFVAASSEGTEYTVTIGRGRPEFSVAVRRGAVLCRPRAGNWRPIRLNAGERLIGIGAATPRADRLDPREEESEFGWVRGSAPSLRFRFPEPSRRDPTPPRDPAPSDPSPPSRPGGPVRRPSGGIIDRLERGPITTPSDPVIR
jgi:hypothetical protein